MCLLGRGGGGTGGAQRPELLLRVLQHVLEVELEAGKGGLDTRHEKVREALGEGRDAQERPRRAREVGVRPEEVALLLPCLAQGFDDGGPSALGLAPLVIHGRHQVAHHDVAQLERLALVGEHLQHLALPPGRDEVRLGEHREGALAVGVHARGPLEHVHRRHVLGRGEHRQDDGVLRGNDALDHVVHLRDDGVVLPRRGRANDAGKVDERQVGSLRGRHLDDNGVGGEGAGLRQRQRVREGLNLVR
mmetsp:Transcript_14489/g.49023  ORF Transcript_14489/g.49023 Transcript_14489/m.49023 type:complete len:247 (-) Transcript_14489:494-1234(-)